MIGLVALGAAQVGLLVLVWGLALGVMDRVGVVVATCLTVSVVLMLVHFLREFRR